MGTILFFIFLASVVSFFVILPIVQARSRQGGFRQVSGNHSAADLVERKESIYAAIKDIEFDFQMGKLSEADFQELRQQYKDEAVKLLKKHEQSQKRQAKTENIQSKKSRGKSQEGTNFCWICGTALTATDKFCANCGNKIE